MTVTNVLRINMYFFFFNYSKRKQLSQIMIIKEKNNIQKTNNLKSTDTVKTEINAKVSPDDLFIIHNNFF